MTFDKGGLPTREGQTVEVLYRGEIRSLHDDGTFSIGVNRSTMRVIPLSECLVSITVLPDPPKPWQAGDAAFVTYRSWAGTTVRHAGGQWVNPDHPAETFTDRGIDVASEEGWAVPLVRAGEVVTQPQDGGAQ